VAHNCDSTDNNHTDSSPPRAVAILRNDEDNTAAVTPGVRSLRMYGPGGRVIGINGERFDVVAWGKSRQRREWRSNGGEM
jgi:hypothetical protein